MNFEQARDQMLGQQIRTWDVLDSQVLQVLRSTPRENFVPVSERELAFADVEIPLPHGQCMMNPKVEARLLQELRVQPFDRAFEIGTGSGYLAACLARLANHVDSIEIFADLSDAAADKISRMDITNVDLSVADATELTATEEYDVVAITASIPSLDDRFIKLLRPEGRLFVVVGTPPVMEARVITMHSDGEWSEQSLFETMLTPMINVDSSEPFVL